MFPNALRLLVLLALPLVAFADQEVTFIAPPDFFAVISTATGKVSRSGPFISVVLDRYTLRANTKYTVPQKVLRYKIGLAFKMRNGDWDVLRWSAPFEIHSVLLPGETRLIENVKALIPVDNLPSLKGSWLVIAVEMDNNGRVGYTYAHSQEGLF